MGEANHVFPSEHSSRLDNRFRRLIHNPEKFLGKLVKPGDVVLDYGCGPGTFTLDLAKMVGVDGKVFAVDLQQDMLDKLKKKTAGSHLPQLQIRKCDADRIGVTEHLDFALVFYVVHELPDQAKFFKEISQILKPGGRLLVVEPVFEVSKNAFKTTIEEAVKQGLTPVSPVKLLLSRGMLLKKK
jgi:ubiquinone/menaquinone biosynthesis C-methylase UbiE